jgi:hypothetical protein
MNELENDISKGFILNDLEAKLIEGLEGDLEGLDFLKSEELKIGNPESIGETMKNIVWDQFQLSIGMDAGESFIEENKGRNLDLRESAHIQTSENFEKGKIAKNNSEINYQERHDNWQGNFKKDAEGEILYQRNGKEILNIESRLDFDKDRPVGSSAIHKDHTVSTGEIRRDPAANAHLSKTEQVKFANSNENLKDLGSAANQSKGDRDAHEWSKDDSRNGIPNKNRFPDVPKDFDQNADVAKKKYQKVKKEGEERSTIAGRKSRINEVKKIGKQSLKVIVFSLLAELLKTIVNKLVVWFKSASKSFSTFLVQMKEAIRSFFENLKQHLKNAADTFLTTIFSAIWGPIIGTIKKAWMFIKQGWKSLKEAIQYIRNPENKDKSFSDIMLQVSKIIVAGLTVGGALLLGETIEKALMTIAPLAIPIPILGSVASVMGIFLGALVSGLIGALALNLIDRIIVKKQKEENRSKQIAKQSEIIDVQEQIIEIKTEKMVSSKIRVSKTLKERHEKLEDVIRESVASIMANDKGDNLFDEIDKL